jgi:hypothetical protein
VRLREITTSENLLLNPRQRFGSRHESGPTAFDVSNEREKSHARLAGAVLQIISTQCAVSRSHGVGLPIPVDMILSDVRLLAPASPHSFNTCRSSNEVCSIATHIESGVSVTSLYALDLSESNASPSNAPNLQAPYRSAFIKSKGDGGLHIQYARYGGAVVLSKRRDKWTIQNISEIVVVGAIIWLPGICIV